MKSFLLLLCIVCLCAGCGSPAAPSQEPTPITKKEETKSESPATNSVTKAENKPEEKPADQGVAKAVTKGKEVNVGTSGFGFVIPTGWTVVDPKDPNFKKIMSDEAKLSPELTQAVKMIESGQLAFLAMDLSGKDPKFADNVNVVLIPGSPDRDFTEADIADFRAELAKTPSVEVEDVELLKTSAGTSLHYSGTITIAGANGSSKNITTAYVWSKAGTSYTVTVSGALSRKAATMKVGEALAQSAHFK